MKNILLYVFCTFLIINCQAQIDEFWGTTAYGGTGNAGVIFSMKSDGTGYQARHNFFVDKPGNGPLFAPAILNDTYYGVTEMGGRHDFGVLYSFNKTTKVYTLLHEFKIEEGIRPFSNVVIINNKIYGTTYDYNNGLVKPGVIYEYDLITNVYSIKKIFTNYSGAVLGAHPAGTLTVFNGKIYGSTLDGGSGIAGSLFEYDPGTDAFRSLFGFGYSNGGYPNGKSPNGGMVLYNNALYGTSGYGGANGAGVIFKFDLTTNSFTKLADFGGTGNGAQPTDGMTLYNGIFYGLTGYGGTTGSGTVYSFDPATNALTFLQQFSYNGPNGANPLRKLTLYNNLLYGSANNNSNNAANIFTYDPATNTLASQFSSPTEGESFTGAFLIDDNKFVTVTSQYTNSMISYDPATKVKTNLFLFEGKPLGAKPGQSLLYANNLLYGSTTIGGTNNLGVVFSFEPITGTYTVLYNLANNAYGLGDFTIMGNTLYAPARNGFYNGSSSQNYGAVFWLNLSNNAASSISAYAATLFNPVGVMVPTDNNNELLMLSSTGGGPYSGGALIRFNSSTNTFYGIPTSYYANNSFPNYTTKTSDGRVFVATQYAGANNQGSLHLQSVGTKTSFKSNQTGRGPNGSIAELNGKYYICTLYDGPVNGNSGTLVEIDPANMTTPILKISFTQTGGVQQSGNLVVANSKLYGVMNSGGATYTNSTGELSYLNKGSVFQYNPANNTYLKLHDFTGEFGKNPTSLIKAPTATLLPLNFIAFNASLCNTNEVCLNWETANENNVSHFEILRSNDGSNFTKIAQQPAKNKVSNIYNAVDITAALSKNYKLFYTIREVDMDGKITASKVVVVKKAADNATIIYPNPVNDVLKIADYSLIKTVMLTDLNGRTIKHFTRNFSNMLVADLAAGIYFIKIIKINGETEQQKIIKR